VAFLQAFQILILWTCSLYLEKEGAFVYDWLIQKAMLGCFHSFIIYLFILDLDVLLFAGPNIDLRFLSSIVECNLLKFLKI
jgi:hypothetical protein